jgi:hypothetical protein
MKRVIYILIAILISGCEYQNNQYHDFITKVSDYQSKVEIIYTEDDAFIDSATFNIEEYFSLYDKLEIDSLYKLDYYYFYFGDGGRPLLLALEKEEVLDTILNKFVTYLPPIVRPNDTLTITGEKYVSFDFFDYADTVLNPISRIKILDNELGYFQYLVFHLQGDRFGLFWHSNYGGLALINSEKALHEILNIESDFTDFTREQKKKIKQINPEPIIKMTNDSCYIDIVGFNAWRGFVRTKYSINRDYPHDVTYITRDTLVAHDCGIMF